MKRLLSISILALFAMLPACSEEAPNPAVVTKPRVAEHDKLRQWHDICLEGDTHKIDQQITKFEAVIKATPHNDLARAYLGSAYALKAKHSFFPTTKLSSLKKGKSLLEAAVAGSPDKPRVRMVRAIAYYKVPKYFDTRPTSIADFEKLLAVIKKGNSSLQKNEQQAILYYTHLAFAEENHPQAEEAKLLCHKIDPNSKYGKLTQ